MQGGYNCNHPQAVATSKDHAYARALIVTYIDASECSEWLSYTLYIVNFKMLHRVERIPLHHVFQRGNKSLIIHLDYLLPSHALTHRETLQGY